MTFLAGSPLSVRTSDRRWSHPSSALSGKNLLLQGQQFLNAGFSQI